MCESSSSFLCCCCFCFCFETETVGEKNKRSASDHSVVVVVVKDEKTQRRLHRAAAIFNSPPPRSRLIDGLHVIVERELRGHRIDPFLISRHPFYLRNFIIQSRKGAGAWDAKKKGDTDSWVSPVARDICCLHRLWQPFSSLNQQQQQPSSFVLLRPLVLRTGLCTMTRKRDRDLESSVTS